MEDLNYGHGGEPAQASNAAKTVAAETDAAKTDTAGVPDAAKSDTAAKRNDRNSLPEPSQRENQELQVAEEPSGYRGDNWATAGPGGTSIRSSTPENAAGHINPSAPGDTGVTPGTTPH